MLKRALVWIVAIAVFVGGAASAKADCRKRILLYIDKSQSMGQGEFSAFRQTLDVARELVRQPALMGGDDRLQVFLLGGDVEELTLGQGDAIEQRLVSLKRPDSAVTDLGRMLEHMQRQLANTTATDRDVVILASDFAHDPTIERTRDTEWRQQNWRKAFSDRRGALTSALLPAQAGVPTRAAFVLIRAPLSAKANASDAIVSRAVLNDLKELLFHEPLDVGTAAASPKAIADAITRVFFVPPKVEAELVAPTKLKVTATNQGCMPITLVRAKVECEVRTSDGREESFPKDNNKLLGTSSGLQQRDVEVDVSGLNCDDRRYTAVVESREADAAKTTTTTKSHLGYEVKRAILGPEWAQDLLELRVKLWGVITKPEDFEAEVRAASDGGVLVVRGRIAPPRDIEPLADQAKVYRVVVSVDKDLRARLLADGISLAVKDATVSAAGTSKVDKDWGAEFYQYVVRPLSVIVGLPFLIWLLLRMARDQGGAVEFFERATTWLSVVAGVVPSVSLVLIGLMSGQVYAWSEGAWLIDIRDALGTAAVGCLVSWALWWAWRARARRKMRAALGAGTSFARSPADFDRRTAFHGATWVCAGLVVVAIVVAACLHLTSPRRGDAAVATVPFVR